MGKARRDRKSTPTGQPSSFEKALVTLFADLLLVRIGHASGGGRCWKSHLSMSARKPDLFRARGRSWSPVHRAIDDLTHPLEPPLCATEPALNSVGTRIRTAKTHFQLFVIHGGQLTRTTWTQTVQVEIKFRASRMHKTYQVVLGAGCLTVSGDAVCRLMGSVPHCAVAGIVQNRVPHKHTPGGGGCGLVSRGWKQAIRISGGGQSECGVSQNEHGAWPRPTGSQRGWNGSLRRL